MSKQIAATHQDWANLVEDVLQQALRKGASAAEVSAGASHGFNVQVRMGEVETIEHNRDKGLALTVYFGQCKGSASTSDTSLAALQDTVDAACHIARFTSADSYAGLADANLLAKNYPDLDLYHPWNMTIEQAVATAKAVEAQGLQLDPRISNSEGVNISTSYSQPIYANSLGFMGQYASSYHSMNCVLIAKDASGMQRDYDYTAARDPQQLVDFGSVARQAAEKTLQRLNAKRLKTMQAPVVFHATVASSLLSHFIAAIRGGNLYRQSSFLLDHIHKPVFASHIQLSEQPHLLKALGSAPFDSEGVATKPRELVKDGVLQGYVLDSYSARRLGLQTTGNAGGIHNLLIATSAMDLAALLKEMGTGLLVTELMGQGVNIVTGDYSRGAAGFWVENGEIQYPVHEITIAGNLSAMFKGIVAIANDVDKRGSIHTGSIWLDRMTIAGE